MDDINDNYLNQVNQGDYSQYGASVFEPITSAAKEMTARGEPYSAFKQRGATGFKPLEMAGSMGGQMPSGEALDAMNQSMGLTSQRYGANAPDPNSAAAIANRNIDKMGITSPERPAMPGTGRTNTWNSEVTPAWPSPGGQENRMNQRTEWHGEETPFQNAYRQPSGTGRVGSFQSALAGDPRFSGGQASNARQVAGQNANPAAGQQLSEEEIRKVRQMVSNMKNADLINLVSQLTKIPAKVLGARRVANPAAYLDSLHAKRRV